MYKRVILIYRELDEAHAYAHALASVNLEPVMVEAGQPAPSDDIAGVLLTGGSDVNPKLYGADMAPETEPPDDARDEAEYAAIEASLDRGLPLLGICRGLQILNVYFGGSLVQHVETLDRHRQTPDDRGLPAHEVMIEPGTLLASIAGTDRWQVNSRHHQAIERLGTGLRVSAWDPRDGTIEAVEYPGARFALAVQWHPEDQIGDPEQRKLFSRFAEALHAS